MGKFASTACCLAVMLFPASAFAIQVSWTDWQTSPDPSSASGQLAVGACELSHRFSPAPGPWLSGAGVCQATFALTADQINEHSPGLVRGFVFVGKRNCVCTGG